MPDPLETFRDLVRCPADAVRWASVLEATAPKAGNVYPGRPFADLTHGDFVAAAEIAAEYLGDSGRPVSLRLFDAVDKTLESIGTNVNLGILLLLAPLVAADESLGQEPADNRDLTAWKMAIENALESMESDDQNYIFRAIARASPGGLGTVGKLDVQNGSDQTGSLLEAMQLAKTYDRVALQYATGYADLINHIVPVVRASIQESGDLLNGISMAHLRLLALDPDTLIARKNGVPVANMVWKRARSVVLGDRQSVAEFDALLRSSGHALNPGTTADLIAAALYLLLRSTP